MANVHPLLVQFDVPEPRPRYGRLMVAGDGTSFDITNSFNVWQDPVTLTTMLAPLPVTASWETTYSGNYARFQKAAYTLPTPTKWKQIETRAAGDYYLQSLDVTERATLTASWSANTGAYISLYVPGLKTSGKNVILKAGWNVGSAGSVEVWFAADGTAQVYKSGVIVGTYNRNDANSSPQAGASGVKSPKSEYLSIVIIPCRRRELLVVASNGTAFSHLFSDLNPELQNTILPASQFSWMVPSGQATVQCAKVFHETSGYVYTNPKRLRYPPPTGATFGSTIACDTVSQNASNVITGSVVRVDGSAYTPNGVIRDVRGKVIMTGSGVGSWGLYAVDTLYDPPTTFSYDGTVDVTQSIKSLTIAVEEDGKSTCTITAIAKQLVDAGVQQPDITSDRTIRIALSDGAVVPVYQDIFRGTLRPPKIEYLEADKTYNWATYTYEGVDRSGDFDLAFIVESYPYDGINASLAILDLMYLAGYDFSTYFGGDSPLLELPYTPNISKGQYTFAPDYGDTSATYLDKIKQEYYATWLTGWFPSVSGYLYFWRNVDAEPTTSKMTLYQSIADAIAGGVVEILRPKRVIRTLNSFYEQAECTQVAVVGQDPMTGTELSSVLIDSAAEDPTTPPASRPRNWRGRPVMYQFRDPVLTSQIAVDAATSMLYSRLTPGRTMIEWESDLLVINTSNRPIWLGDIIKLIDTDGVSILGNYRVIAIPSIEFVNETTIGFSVRKAQYRAVYVSDGIE
jgi:hypothetical protein